MHGSRETQRTFNRWLVVVAAIFLNLALGALYSWPVFSNYLENRLTSGDPWNSFETQLVFSMATVFLAVGVIVAGQLSERREPKTLLWIAALFTGAGYALGGLLPLRPLYATLTLGVMIGFGIGMAYALPISLAAKWFPDRKGLVTGIALAGFGIGSVLWSQTFDLFLAGAVGIRATFVIYGALFSAMILATMRFLRNPPAGHAQSLGHKEPAPGGSSSTDRTPEHEFSPTEVVRQRQLYFLFYTFMVGSAIGLTVIGLSKSYPIERLTAAGYPLRFATNITRIGALVLFPVFNGFGRVAFGWLSDRFGWKPVMITSYAVQAALLAALPTLVSMPATTIISLPILAMCYGGNFTIFPIATGQIWGPGHLAANYGVVFTAFGVGALVGPPLSGMARDAGAINTAFLIAAVLAALGAVLMLIVRKPSRRSGT